MTQRQKILVVDDSPMSLKFTTAMLTGLDAEIVTAESGEEAIKKTIVDDFDLILMDVVMPDIDGFEAVKTIRKEEKNRFIPIIFITAVQGDELRIVKGLSLGAIDFITKPVSREILCIKATNLLELRKDRKEIESTKNELGEKVKELKKSEEHLNFALQTSQIGAWELDLVDKTVNRTLIHDNIFGYETLLPLWTYQMFLDHVLQEDRSAVELLFQKAVETQSDLNFECRIRRRTNGEVRWIWITGKHELNAEGKPLRISGTVQEITDRKLAEDNKKLLHDEI